jgi:quinol monooxygenase YgiN
MIIVSGTLRLQPGRRDDFLKESLDAMKAARVAVGCHAFVVSADPIEVDIVNVYEEWGSEEALLRFRGEGPSADMRGMIAGADVRRHYVAKSGPA